MVESRELLSRWSSIYSRDPSDPPMAAWNGLARLMNGDMGKFTGRDGIRWFIGSQQFCGSDSILPIREKCYTGATGRNVLSQNIYGLVQTQTTLEIALLKEGSFSKKNNSVKMDIHSAQKIPALKGTSVKLESEMSEDAKRAIVNNREGDGSVNAHLN